MEMGKTLKSMRVTYVMFVTGGTMEKTGAAREAISILRERDGWTWNGQGDRRPHPTAPPTGRGRGTNTSSRVDFTSVKSHTMTATETRLVSIEKSVGS